ncbi:ATP-binding protein [Alkalibacillus sp. S2W]|uniref:ATP-binding protein n=1 Tax=Alkalibacillus sp. S2W TaxID=3386553 RepID=UPI00398D209A
MEKVNQHLSSIEQAGERECSNCGNIYPVYKTPKGILGACKPCEDQKLKESLDLPKQEDLPSIKKHRFINRFMSHPDQLEGATIRSYQADSDSQKALREWVIDFVKNFGAKEGDSLVVSGQAGLGKSHVAYATAKALRGQNYKVLYIETPKLLNYFREAYNDWTNYTHDDLYAMLQGLDLLILDDIGAEYIKDSQHGAESWASEILYNVLDDRQGKSKIITTNYTERQLAHKYGFHGGRITSRMYDGAKTIRLEGQDFRRKDDDDV